MGLRGLGAVAGTRVLSSWLYGIESNDVVTYASMVMVLVGVALVANWIPARRAARVEPIEALRQE